jgi:hypothetical protein
MAHESRHRDWLAQAENDLAFAESAVDNGFFGRRASSPSRLPTRPSRPQADQAIALARRFIDVARADLAATLAGTPPRTATSI